MLHQAHITHKNKNIFWRKKKRSCAYLTLALDGLNKGHTLANLGVLASLSHNKVLFTTLHHSARVDLVTCTISVSNEKRNHFF